MSFQDNLSNAINSVNNLVYEFAQQIAQKYENVSVEDLMTLWNGGKVPADSATVSKAVSKAVAKPQKTLVEETKSCEINMSPDELMKLKKPELQELCRHKGVKCSGTKVQLVTLLLGTAPSTAPKSTSSGSSKARTKTESMNNKPVIKKITSQVKTLAIRKNEHGNHEHPETSFVFNPKTHKVIGKQNLNGSIDVLTAEDIETCNQYKFDYELPENLDGDVDLEKVHVEELDSDSDSENEQDETKEETKKPEPKKKPVVKRHKDQPVKGNKQIADENESDESESEVETEVESEVESDEDVEAESEVESDNDSDEESEELNEEELLDASDSEEEEEESDEE